MVGAASTRAFPDGFAPAPSFIEVACDHLTYFEHPDALAAIVTTLGGNA